jgi:hypothetical protein
MKGTAVTGIIWMLVSLVGVASAQSKSPQIFDVSEVTVGAQHINTLYALAVGRWSDAEKDAGPISAEIECYKRLGFCADAEASLSHGQATVGLDDYAILRWDSKELIAVDSSPMCLVNTIRFDFRNKLVTYTPALKGETANPICKGIKDTKPGTAFLEGIE